MSKRLLTLSTGIVLGVLVAQGGLRIAEKMGWVRSGEQRALNYFQDVLRIVHESHVDPQAAEYESLSRSALHGMVESLDPHSEFMEARAFTQLEEDMSSEFGGIGVQVELRKGKIVVVAPMAGTPSERAGLKRGDEIVTIDGKSLDTPTMETVVDRLRGKPKTPVQLSLMRPSEKREFAVTLMREMIKTESVPEPQVLPGDIGYLRITQFSERTGEEFIAGLNTLAKSEVRGLILDLRNNPGGLLDAAVEVAEPFFKKGELIVYTQGRQVGDRTEFRAESDDPPLRVPTVVLINESSASAAEIVAGALKDAGRALVVGERSFGKGSVQSVLTLRNGEGLRLTTARYYTPSGVTIHEKGVAPHIEVIVSDSDDENIRLQHSRDDVTDPKEFKERFGVELLADRQKEVALELLQGLTAIESLGLKQEL